MTPLNVISGFRNTGIYPLDKTKLLPAEDESSPVISQHIPFLQPLQTPQPQSHFHVHIYQSTPSSALGHSQMHFIHNTLSPSSVSSPFEQWKLQSSSRMSCSDVSYYDSQLSSQKNNDDNSLLIVNHAVYNLFIGIDGVRTELTSRGSRSTTRTQLTNEIGNNSILIVNQAVYNLFIGIDGVGTGLPSQGSRSTTCTQLTNEKGNNTILIS